LIEVVTGTHRTKGQSTRFPGLWSVPVGRTTCVLLCWDPKTRVVAIVQEWTAGFLDIKTTVAIEPTKAQHFGAARQVASLWNVRAAGGSSFHQATRHPKLSTTTYRCTALRRSARVPGANNGGARAGTRVGQSTKSCASTSRFASCVRARSTTAAQEHCH
jgi:hypothetical protein